MKYVMSEIFLWAVKIQCSVCLVLSTITVMADDECVPCPRQLSNSSCPPRFLVNMKTRFAGIPPYLLFEENPEFKQESNFIQKNNNVTLIKDFSDHTENLNAIYFFSEMNNTASSVKTPIQKFICRNNSTLPSNEHIPIPDKENFLTMEIYLISFCVKMTNVNTMFPPRIHQELLLLFYFEKRISTGFIEKKWGLSYLTSSKIRIKNQQVEIWDIGFIYVCDEKIKENCVLDGIRFFNKKPTESEIRKFILETDFGNCDIYNFSEYNSVVNVTILNIFLYSPHEYLKGQIDSEPPLTIKKERVKIYNEVLKGLTSTQKQL